MKRECDLCAQPSDIFTMTAVIRTELDAKFLCRLCVTALIDANPKPLTKKPEDPMVIHVRPMTNKSRVVTIALITASGAKIKITTTLPFGAKLDVAAILREASVSLAGRDIW